MGILLRFLLLLGLATAGSLAAHAATLELREATATISAGGVTTTRDIALPYHWDRANGSRPGEADIELNFVLPPPTFKEAGNPHGLYFERIGNAADIYLNGTLLARLGDTSARATDDFAKAPQYISIPPQLLQQVNTMHIHLRADGGRRGGLSTVVVGPHDQVYPYFAGAFNWRVAVSFVVTAISLLVGAVAMALWFTQTDPLHRREARRDNLYLCAGVAEFCWALRVGDVAIEHPPMAWPWWGVVITAAFAGWICCIALLCHHMAGWHRHRSMPLFKSFIAAMFASSILAAWLSFTLYQPVWLTAWLGFANAFFVCYGAAYLWAALHTHDNGRRLLAFAGALNIAVGVRDWITIRISGGYGDSTWIRYSSVLFGLSLGYIVITRFRAATAQARDLRANLEARVLLREVELQQSYQKLEQLAREQERASERTRILRDMHDGVGSHISTAIRQLQSGRASSDAVLLTLRDSLDQLKLSIDAINLPPGDVTALLANLRYRLEPRFAASDIELQWDVDLLEPVEGLDANAMRQLQFMVFEALSNVLQHAQASVLRIEARAAGAEVVLRIIDNGRGFDVAAPLRKGLSSMRERAQAIGAVLALQSVRGRTLVEITLG